MIKDYYQELHVHPKAVPELINSSYKILKEKYKRDIHPDELESWMTGLNEAYQVLSNMEKRKKYDQVYFQEYGGIAELEHRLNRHKGLLATLSAIFVILIIVAVYFLYSIKGQVSTLTEQAEFRDLLAHQTKALKDDLESFKKEKGKYPSSGDPAILRKTLEKYKNKREEQFWGRMSQYEQTKSGGYRIIFNMDDSTLIVTPDSSLSK